MATSSILGGSKAPEEISGKDVQALGPSDNSDSGSDAVGAYGEDELSSDSDAAGTGERASAALDIEETDTDILPDHIEQAPGTAAGTDARLDEDASDELSDVDELTDSSDDLGIKLSDDGEEGSRRSR